MGEAEGSCGSDPQESRHQGQLRGAVSGRLTHRPGKNSRNTCNHSTLTFTTDYHVHIRDFRQLQPPPPTLFGGSILSHYNGWIDRVRKTADTPVIEPDTDLFK